MNLEVPTEVMCAVLAVSGKQNRSQGVLHGAHYTMSGEQKQSPLRAGSLIFSLSCFVSHSADLADPITPSPNIQSD